MELRKVIVSKHAKKLDEAHPGRVHYVLEPAGEALFHQFGVNYEEFENGPGNYTTAVIEWPDGRVENVPVEHVQFAMPTSSASIESALSAARAEERERCAMVCDAQSTEPECPERAAYCAEAIRALKD